MKSTLLLFISMLVIAHKSNGQVIEKQVISSFSLHDGQGNLIESTLGEVMISTYIQNGYILNQGFHTGEIDRNTPVIDLEGSLIEIDIFPNPTQEYLQIQSKSSTLISGISIFNQQGKIVLSQSKNSNQQTIDVGHLASGLYGVFCHIKSRAYFIDWIIITK